ncbi:MAG: mitochondrial fission ELM1 family protein [Candidatus Omnitrophica bacterium]|nr:mitochondrial fission ELM1 family protein [Candidatus Omnitrophota bacterium]
MVKILDLAGYFVLRGLVGFFNLLPHRIAIGIGSILGRCAYYMSGRRRVAYADLKSALGNSLSEAERWRVVKKHYAHLGKMLVEILRFPSFDQKILDRVVRIHHRERFEEAIQQGKGVVLLTAHFGNWELLQIVSGILGKPMHVLAREQKHSKLNDFLNDLREIHGSVSVKRGIAVRDFLRALRKQDLVGILGDQDAGRDGGIIIPFFGRKTTIPTGAFELANRTGAPVLPCFIVRGSGAYHDIFVEPPIETRAHEKSKEFVKCQTEKYVKILENYIGRYPDQWLWEAKRWKYTWTKRLLILSDGKAGHVKQSKALAKAFRDLQDQYDRPGMEYPTRVIDVIFKSGVHRILFPFVCLLILPWAQGRIRWLSFFFKKETSQALVEASADFVISAGASLAPLNLCLAKDSKAKSIVIMKPSFPFQFFRYDLAVIPAHDRGKVPTRIFRRLLALGESEPQKIQEASKKIADEIPLPEKIKISVFLGGPTRHFRMELSKIEVLFSALDRLSKKVGDYLVTTSRRTPDFIARYLKDKIARDRSCQMLVVAKEDPRPEVVLGMMDLADILIVSEDSISMISEAVQTGKKVIVLNLDTKSLPDKHRRFQKALLERSAVVSAAPEELEEKILQVIKLPPSLLLEEEKVALQKILREIL